MPDIVAGVLATPGLIWLVAGVFVAGLVRGFAGFGTAMIFLPVAAQWLSPFQALTVMIFMDLIGPLPNLPRAIRDGLPGDIGRLTIGMALAVPFGVMVLSAVRPEVFRYGVSTTALLLLVVLISGWQYRRTLPRGVIYGAGGLGGFLAGSVGLPGPPVIMFYMATARPPEVIRANTIMYLMAADIVMLTVLSLFDHLVPSAVWLGLFLSLPYLLANVIGAAIFDPARIATYRGVAYAIIATSAISGLPLFD